MTKQVLKKYSVAFKRHVVSEYEQGKSAYELKKRYGISGNGTVERWIREYGREGLRHQVMRIQHVDEQDRVKELESRVKELESALAQVTLDRLMYQAMVEVAERDYGLDLKKSRSQVIEQAKTLKQEIKRAPTVEAICEWCGISRQAHHQQVKREQAQEREAQRVCAEVRKVRRYHPRMGTRKLQHVTEPQLKLAGIKIGRDRLFEILKENDLLVEPKRSYHRTTHPGTWRCENLLADAIINGPNQAWAGDITYLVTDEGFCYLVLLTDVYSRYIVGFDLSTSLCVEGAERALHQAIKAQKEVPDGLIHHSDRGVQYTCRSYRRKLKKHGMRSSMGQTGNCYDNALAERVNGILKQEYGLDGHFATVAQAREAVVQAIWLYNHERPHNSLEKQTPYDVHQHQLRKRRPQSKSSIFRAQGAKVLSVGLAA